VPVPRFEATGGNDLGDAMLIQLPRTKSHAGGFTLIELLVVIAIIALLAAIIFPVFSSARDKARQSACLSNMKQIGLGAMQYLQDNDETTVSSYWSGANSVGWAGKFYLYINNPQVFVCPSEQFKTAGLPNDTVDGVAQPDFPLSYSYNENIRGASESGVNFDGLPVSQFSSPSSTVMLWEMDPTANNTYANCVPLESPDEGTAGSTNNPTYCGPSKMNNGTAGGSYSPTGGLLSGASQSLTYAPTNMTVAIRHLSGGNGGNYLFADGHAKYLQGASVSCSGNAAKPTNAQGSGVAEGVFYSGAGKHAATFSVI